MYGIRMGEPGAQEYYDSIVALYAQWGVDFIKCDDICNTNLYVEHPYSAAHEIEMRSMRLKSAAGTSCSPCRRDRR